MPAHELESRVTEKLLAFLKSDAEIFDGLSSTGESPAAGRNLVAAAKKLAIRMSSLPAAELRDLLAAFLRRVVVGENQIEVRLDAEELRRLLGNGDTSTTQNLASVRKLVALNSLITLTIQAKQKRFGGEVHLIVPPNSSPSVGQPKPSLIKALARARNWYERVIEGKAVDMRSLARQAGLTERYVGKVFGCALLAPDIVESILKGSQPQDLTFEKLCKHIPLSWAEQRRQFGFTSANQRRASKPILQ